MARISYYVLAAFILLTLALTYSIRKLATPAAPTVVGGLTKVSGAGHTNFMTGPLPDQNTMTWVKTSKGKRFQAHPKSAPYLLAFVNKLEAAGAPINSIGGYNRRHIAGSSRWSQHAYGNAIDIDQLGRNRVTAAFAGWSRSHPDVVRNAARKHGIISGGDWKAPDYGHFEWGGTTRSSHSRIPASIRFNNPGAQYPAEWAKAFGMDGYAVIGGGHLIARFPDPVAGAAANMFLLNKSYVGMTIGAAGTKWTGGNGSGVPGYDPAQTLTHEMLNERSFVIPFMKAIAEREAGRESPLTDDQWIRAFNAYRAGKYSAGIKAASAEIDSISQSNTWTKELPNSRALAFTVRQGRRYHATVRLPGIEQWATNETIAQNLRKVGFSEIEVEGSGHTREARALWPKPDSTSSIDEHLVDVFELPDG
ncbi:M15 family metallopeptidase [Bradyrhizobium sp. LTSP857]|uniref:M15 family metallopeptidase n=1 Tax=Bradyrhizobium sp. LTSP857 TaxID=1619231 RepID=UPI000678466D|nr:M15 family metallopeptidase [Bradyrhizobium sp. LTSP857]